MLTRTDPAPAAVPVYETIEPRGLAELFTPCFMLILQLRASDAYGDPAALRARVDDLLGEVEREARRLDVPPEDVREALFPVVAFVDEAILSSEWVGREAWMERPIQLERYDRFDAGEEFFIHLRRLLDQPAARKDVLEVYYLCLALGFKGKYMLHDQGELHALLDHALEALERAPGHKARTLSPHGTPRGRVTEEIRRTVPAWVVLVTAAVIALIVYLGMYVYVSREADRTVQQIEAVANG